MADHTITLSNTLNLFEPRATVWGNTGATTMTWGTDVWGAQSEDFITDVGKFLAETLSMADAVTSEILNLITNTLTFSSALTIEYLLDGIWYYIFPGGITNAEDRISTTWGDASSVSTSYSTPVSPNTTWS